MRGIDATQEGRTRQRVRASLAVGLGVAMWLWVASPAAAAIFSPSGASLSGSDAGQVSGTVATFGSNDAASCFSASVDWGDGSQPSTGTVSAAGGSGQFAVSGSHQYEAGDFTVTVTINESSSGTCARTATQTTVTGPASITEAPLTAAGVLVPATDGQAFSGQVASFKDTQGSGNPPSHYSATIDWGDGTTGAGTITANGSGGYDVAGAHTYGIGSVGTRTIGVTIHDVGGTDVVATSTASVACAAPPAPSAFPGPGPATTGTPDQRWITQVYRDVLGREPDQASLSFWSTTLEAVSRTTVAQAILSSAEYRNALIHALYQQLLHRPVDAVGLSFWTTQLSNGITQEQFRAGLAGTQEYEANRGGGTNGGFLCAAYNDFLGRAIDPTALNSFLAALQSASATRMQVVQSILSSTEYRGDLITGFFGRYMHRGADPASLTFFLNLLSHGSTDEQVIAALLGSDEYFNRFAGGGSLIGRVRLRGTGLIAVNLLRPAHLGLLVVRVQGRRRIPLAVRPSVPRVHKLGIVDLGRHSKGRLRIRWNLTVKGHRLRPGRYTVTLLGLRANGRIADQSAPVTITVRR